MRHFDSLLRTLLFTAALFVNLLTIPLTVNAQLKRVFTYQGTLLENNQLVNGSRQITFKIYNSAGATLWTSTQTLTLSNGIFSVPLGQDPAFPLSMDFHEMYYLGITPSGGNELTPKTEIDPAPYAILATHAVTADSLSTPGIKGVTSLNGRVGRITLMGGGNTAVVPNGDTILISSSGVGGTGMQGVQSTDGSIGIANPSGPVANLTLPNASIPLTKLSTFGAGSGNVITYNGSGLVYAPPPTATLALPFNVSDSSANLLFAITQRGTGRLMWLRNVDTSSSTQSTLIVDASSNGAGGAGAITARSTNSFGLIASGGSSSGGVFGVVTDGSSNTTFSAGAGITGFSNVGNGVAGISYDASHSGVDGSSTNGNGVRGTSTNGIAGSFTVTNSSNANPAIEGVTSGAGPGVFGSSGGGPGVKSTFNGVGAGTSLEVNNGAIKVTGGNQPAFIHTATPANIALNYTVITNALTDGDPSASLFVTPLQNPAMPIFCNFPIGVYYLVGAGKWVIFNEGGLGTFIPVSAQFNVLVIKH